MNYQYIYPPRPESKIPPSELDKFDDYRTIAQPKLMGSCGVLILDKNGHQLMNRHKQLMTNVKIDPKQLQKLYKGTDYMILVGEYLNKNQKHRNGAEFNHKYVIFDILVYDGVHLVGTDVEYRQDLLNKLYRKKSKEFDGFIRKISDDVFIVENFYENFVDIFLDLVDIPLYEGLVLKAKNIGLESGVERKKNNCRSQIKARKPTTGYSF